MFSPNGFNATFSNLELAVGRRNRTTEPWTEGQLLMAAELLEKSRDLYLVKRTQWDEERGKNKSNGVRRATNAEKQALDSGSWFDFVSSTTRPKRNWLSLAEWVEECGVTPEPFGSELSKDLRVVRDAMPATHLEPSGNTVAHYGPYSQLVKPSNVVSIPERIYAEPISESIYKSLSPTQRTMADCLYSRSNSGFTRQRHLKRIVTIEQPWVIPYVVLAIGDYVIEVVQEVANGLRSLDEIRSWQSRSYRLFADHNTDFIELVRQRATSYWNCYHSREFAFRTGTDDRPRYPSFEILESIGQPRYRMVYTS